MKRVPGGDANGDGNLWKGLTAGVIGGLAASIVMNQFQAIWHGLAEGESRGHGAQSMQKGSPSHGAGRKLRKHGREDPDDTAPQRLANYISKGLLKREITEGEKDVAGRALHYAFGASTGAVYGAAAEFMPQVTVGAGLPFGAAVWLVADEIVTPLCGLSKPPTQYPLSTHAYALSAHLVFGLTAEIVRRGVRSAW